MKLDWSHWLHGLAAAFIGGGASAISASFAVMVNDPRDFNFGSGLGNTLEVAATTFIVAGIFSAALYLKQSPIPPIPKEWDGEKRRDGDK
jgi:hypothetical protein